MKLIDSCTTQLKAQGPSRTCTESEGEEDEEEGTGCNYGRRRAAGRERLLDRKVQRFRGGLVFKAHRLLYHSTPGFRVIKKKRSGGGRQNRWMRLRKARTCPRYFSGLGIEGARSNTRAQHRRPACACGLEQKKGRIHSPGCPLQLLKPPRPPATFPTFPRKSHLPPHQPWEVPQTVPWNIFDLPCQHHVYLVLCQHWNYDQYKINF